jgi:hypothetical protein
MPPPFLRLRLVAGLGGGVLGRLDQDPVLVVAAPPAGDGGRDAEGEREAEGLGELGDDPREREVAHLGGEEGLVEEVAEVELLDEAHHVTSEEDTAGEGAVEGGQRSAVDAEVGHHAHSAVLLDEGADPTRGRGGRSGSSRRREIWCR